MAEIFQYVWCISRRFEQVKDPSLVGRTTRRHVVDNQISDVKNHGITLIDETTIIGCATGGGKTFFKRLVSKSNVIIVSSKELCPVKHQTFS
jgi:hypothetical protein